MKLFIIFNLFFIVSATQKVAPSLVGIPDGDKDGTKLMVDSLEDDIMGTSEFALDRMPEVALEEESESYENGMPEEALMEESESYENGIPEVALEEETESYEYGIPEVALEEETESYMPEVVHVEMVAIDEHGNELTSNFDHTDAEESFETMEFSEAVFVALEDTIESSTVEIHTNLDNSANFMDTNAEEHFEFQESPEVTLVELEDIAESPIVEINTNLDNSANLMATGTEEYLEIQESPEVVLVESAGNELEPNFDDTDATESLTLESPEVELVELEDSMELPVVEINTNLD